jgi:VCBS repeat-containing protein
MSLITYELVDATVSFPAIPLILNMEGTFTYDTTNLLATKVDITLSGPIPAVIGEFEAYSYTEVFGGIVFSGIAFSALNPPFDDAISLRFLNPFGNSEDPLISFLMQSPAYGSPFYATSVTGYAVPIPTAEADRAHVQQGRLVTVDAAHGVLANDTDPILNDTLTVSGVDGEAANVGRAVAGTYGTLILNADGGYTYLAAHNNHALPADGVGLDTFTYSAQEGAGGPATTTLTVVVTQQNETYLGGTAGVTINGPNRGNAVLDGGAGKDVLIAGKGETVLIGGPGDTLTGGTGKETFVFAPNFGQNTITNFNTYKDTIQLDRSEFADFHAVLEAAHQNGADTVIAYDANDIITLNNVALNHLYANDFHFV